MTDIGENTGDTATAGGAKHLANPAADFPWLQSAWSRTAADLDALHHGLLVGGVDGVAKREFALGLAQLLLCSQANRVNGASNTACGQCQNCVLFAAASHPDFHVLTTELEWRDGRAPLIAKYCDRYQDAHAREQRANPGRVISVAQVRLLIDNFHHHPHIAARKVALLVPADRMNVNAANALLKLLEEPPDDSILILVSASAAHLPATVRSRCVTIAIDLPPQNDTAAWLAARIDKLTADDAARALASSNGAPLSALQQFESGALPLQAQLAKAVGELARDKAEPIELAAKWKAHDFLQVVDWLQRFNCALIKMNCAGAADAPDAMGMVATSGIDAARLSAERLFVLYDKIGYYRNIAREQLNEQLALEELMLMLQGALRAR